MTITVSLNQLANLQNENTAVTQINQNSNLLTTGFVSALNTTGDQMQGTLDMNSQQIVNLPAPATAASPLRLIDASSITALPSVLSGNNVYTGNNTFSGTNKFSTISTPQIITGETTSPMQVVASGEYGALFVGGSGTTATVVFTDAYGTGNNQSFANYIVRRANGTVLSPTPLQSQDIIGTIGGHGNDGNTTAGQQGYCLTGNAQIRFVAGETWASSGTTSTNNGEFVGVFATPNGQPGQTGLKQVAKFVANNTTSVGISVGTATSVNGSINLAPSTFTSLPPTPTVGTIAVITDGSTSTWGAAVTGGSTLAVMVWYNGSNWTVAGK